MSAHQVLVNLIGGSAGTLRSGGALLVSVERCLVDHAVTAPGKRLAPGGYVKLAVCARASQNGAGTETRGWGFELAVVEGIVEGHGGAVIAETTPDGSRTVACLFPALETRARLAEGA
jgi:K+-sensing histidine kinase KdpD